MIPFGEAHTCMYGPYMGVHPFPLGESNTGFLAVLQHCAHHLDEQTNDGLDFHLHCHLKWRKSIDVLGKVIAASLQQESHALLMAATNRSMQRCPAVVVLCVHVGLVVEQVLHAFDVALESSPMQRCCALRRIGGVHIGQAALDQHLHFLQVVGSGRVEEPDIRMEADAARTEVALLAVLHSVDVLLSGKFLRLGRLGDHRRGIGSVQPTLHLRHAHVLSCGLRPFWRLSIGHSAKIGLLSNTAQVCCVRFVSASNWKHSLEQKTAKVDHVEYIWFVYVRDIKPTLWVWPRCGVASDRVYPLGALKFNLFLWWSVRETA